jgi:cytoskeletal protein CcmA (bactofilin family)
MKGIQLVAALMVGLVLLAGCTKQQTDEPGLLSGAVVFGGRHRIAGGETLNGTLLMLDGQLTVAEGAGIGGEVYMVGGRLEVNGQIGGNVSVLGGEVNLGPTAKIAGNLGIGGGTVHRSPAATVGGEVVSGLQVPSRLAVSETRSRVERVVRSVVQALLLATAAFVLIRLRARPVYRVAEAATRHPLISGAMGILVGVVGLVLLVLIAFTIILIPIALLGIVVLGLAVAYGWIAFGVALGRVLVRWRQLSVRPATAAFLGTVVFMIAVDVVNLVPVVGGLTGVLATTVGFGAVLLTRFGIRRFVPVTYPDAPEAA